MNRLYPLIVTVNSNFSNFSRRKSFTIKVIPAITTSEMILLITNQVKLKNWKVYFRQCTLAFKGNSTFNSK